MLGSSAIYNEIDPHAVEWLTSLSSAGLVLPGPVVTRSIKELSPDELRDRTQVHLFAGIGGWPHALRLAGWPDDRPVWTGSCPCQPFSSTGRGEGQDDARHLWPDMFRLIRECRPHVVFGEQVASAVGHGWLDGVSSDLEREGYAVGAAVLGAHSVGSPHVRQRLYWVADLRGERREWGPRLEGDGRQAAVRGEAVGDARDGGGIRGVRLAAGDGRRQERQDDGGRDARGGTQGGVERPWRNFDALSCRDGKTRRIEPGLEPLAHGVSGRVVVRRPSQQPDAPAEAEEEHWYNRAGALKGFGNAIVPQTAAEFVSAFMDVERESR